MITELVTCYWLRFSCAKYFKFSRIQHSDEIKKNLYLQECFFLFKVLAYHRGHMIRFRVGTQFVCSPTPVFFPLIFLFQALQHTAYLPARRTQVRSEQL